MIDRDSAARSVIALGRGSRLGSYEIVAPLRAGGMATLFLGRRVGPAGFARLVAIKVVHAHLASNPAFVEMFLDEARLAARIQHPNVVHTEELGEALGMYYLAMEYVRGCTLSQFLARLAEQDRTLAPEIAAHIVMRLADGLHAAHEVRDEAGHALGVVHRDVSPQNVLLSYDGQVKLIDFGVAKSAGRSTETTGGFLKGKISYMSPEQAWGRAIDRRADVYALGIVLWECLTQRRLFDAHDDDAALERVRAPHVGLPSRFAPAVSLGLDCAVLTALAVPPEARFQTAQEFRRAIGHGCPSAAIVEPDELAALLVSTMAVDIAAEERVAPELTRTVRAEVLGSADAMSVAPTSAAVSVASRETEPPTRVRATRARSARRLKRRRWQVLVASGLLLLIGGVGARVLATRPSAGESDAVLALPSTQSPVSAVRFVVLPPVPTEASEPVVLLPSAATEPPSTTAARAPRHAHVTPLPTSSDDDDTWPTDDVAPLDTMEGRAHVFVPSLASVRPRPAATPPAGPSPP